MKTTSWLLTGMIFLFSCKKNSEPPPPLDGVYTGTFSRVGMVLVQPVTVQLSFTGNLFKGESDQNQAPAICNGGYSLSADSIEFKNACHFPADFDWTLILGGKFKIERLGDSLIISRMYMGFNPYSDTYRLKKQ
jgi:hypothetical protein